MPLFQAARVLEFPGHGLAYLLDFYCGFKVGLLGGSAKSWVTKAGSVVEMPGHQPAVAWTRRPLRC